MSEHDEQQPGIRISISPGPTDEEIAAVAAVVAALAVSAGEIEDTRSESAPDRWALAGRYEAMRSALWSQDLRD